MLTPKVYPCYYRQAHASFSNDSIGKNRDFCVKICIDMEIIAVTFLTFSKNKKI